MTTDIKLNYSYAVKARRGEREMGDKKMEKNGEVTLMDPDEGGHKKMLKIQKFIID